MRVYGYSWSRREREGVRREFLNAAPEQSYWGQRGGAILSSCKETSWLHSEDIHSRGSGNQCV